MKTFAEIKAEVDRRAGSIGATDHQELPTYGRSEETARPHLELDARGYHFVVSERGCEHSRRTTSYLDELLYWIFEKVTFSLAGVFEVSHRDPSQDCRRLIFRRQIELLSQLSPSWGEREDREHQRILREHPFDDASNARVILTQKLRKSGRSPEEAWRLACERYPLPVG